MLRTLLFVICAVRAEYWDNDDTTRNSLKVWLDNLKRRLMTDNYDYQPSSSEVELRAQDNNPLNAKYTTTDTSTNAPTDDLPDAPQDKIYQQIQFEYDSSEKQMNKAGTADDQTTINSLYMPHQLADDVYTPLIPRNSIEERDDYHGISRNDLQMYVKDSKGQAPDPVNMAPTSVSYKIIQPSLLSRRAGGAAPRFIEEVGANGVSLLSVDGAPFPEFQLPAARRQYQAVKDSLSGDWLD